MRQLRKLRALALILILLFAVLLTGCDEQSAGEQDAAARDRNAEQLVQQQPGGTMDYSPTREGINDWMQTWEDRGQVAYVYLLAANGEEVGYYVMEGPPISYCAAMAPPVESESNGNGGMVTIPSQAMDGAYYSGNQCSQYYGFDAVTGEYVEYTIGNGMNHLVHTTPREVEVEPFTGTSVDDVERSQGGG